MVEKAEVKPESLLNLDDLLQCPVCYEIPSGQIFQCNEGHHVCGRCKMRLDVCPVCRALFFGTRNYAMEELIANFRKLRAFKLGAKPSNGSGSSESSTPAKDTTLGEHENDVDEDDDDDAEENNINVSNQLAQRAPPACKGLFRCLCCKSGHGERLPAARLLNHLRYFHAPDLLEGRTDNGEYLQIWQFSTVPDKLVTAIRIADMGIFFLTIEINDNAVCAWLSMAASPWVAHAFNYTVTICGNDREAIFSDCVWSVRSCEGSLKKRGHCLIVRDADAQALVAPSTIGGKLCVRRTPPDQLASQAQPRAVLRVANRVNQDETNHLEPFLQDLQNDVARLSRAFATLGREANALGLSETQLRDRIENVPDAERYSSGDRASDSSEVEVRAGPQVDPPAEAPGSGPALHMSRNARRRMRLRLRLALNGPIPPTTSSPASSLGPVRSRPRQNGYSMESAYPPATAPSGSPPSSSGGPSRPQTSNATRNKKKRRHRR